MTAFGLARPCPSSYFGTSVPGGYRLLPALGPCYTTPDVWTGIADRIPHARGGQAQLWENYLRMLAGRTGPLRQFNPTRGIGAMPSVHVAAHALFALWARERSRILGRIGFFLTALTFVGSVVTGWHYAIDAYAGLLLAILCWQSGRRLGTLGQALRPNFDQPRLESPQG